MRECHENRGFFESEILMRGDNKVSGTFTACSRARIIKRDSPFSAFLEISIALPVVLGARTIGTHLSGKSCSF